MADAENITKSETVDNIEPNKVTDAEIPEQKGAEIKSTSSSVDKTPENEKEPHHTDSTPSAITSTDERLPKSATSIATTERAPAQDTFANSEPGIPYTKPMEDPLEKASRFLAKHDIFELLQDITAGIAYKRPEQPLQFMIEEIEKLQEEDRRRQGVITKPKSKAPAPAAQTAPASDAAATAVAAESS